MASEKPNNQLVEAQLVYSTSPSSNKVGDATPFSGIVAASIHGNTDGTNSNDHPQVTSPMTNIQNAISEMLKTIRNSTACTSETINCQKGPASESGATKVRPETDGNENNGKIIEVQESPPSPDITTKIKRPMNAFMVWAREYRAILSKGFPKESNSQISVRLGDIWSNLTNDEKKPFYERADKLRRQHEKDYPDWVYQPNKKRKLASSTLPMYSNPKFMVNTSTNNFGVPQNDKKIVKILPRPATDTSTVTGTPQGQVFVQTPQAHSTVYFVPANQTIIQGEETASSQQSECTHSPPSQGIVFQATSTPKSMHQSVPSIIGMHQTTVTAQPPSRQQNVLKPVSTATTRTVNHSPPAVESSGPVQTSTKDAAGATSTDAEVSPLAADRFQTLLYKHPITSVIGQLSPECKPAEVAAPKRERQSTRRKTVKPANSKAPGGETISSSGPVMSTGFESTSWSYMNEPYPRLPAVGYPSQVPRVPVTPSPLMQQQGHPVVQLPSPHHYVTPNHPCPSVHPCIHQVMVPPMGASAVFAPVVHPMEMRPDYSQPPPPLVLPIQPGVVMYPQRALIHPAVHGIGEFNQQEMVGFPAQAGIIQTHPCKQNTSSKTCHTMGREGRKRRHNNGNNNNSTNSNNNIGKKNDNSTNSNIGNSNNKNYNSNSNNNSNKNSNERSIKINNRSNDGNATANKVSDQHCKTKNYTYMNTVQFNNKVGSDNIVTEFVDQTKTQVSVSHTVSTTVNGNHKTSAQKHPTASNEKQQETEKGDGTKPYKSETAPLPRNKSFLQTLTSPISTNEVAEQLATLIRAPTQPYAVAKTACESHTNALCHHNHTSASQPARPVNDKLASQSSKTRNYAVAYEPVVRPNYVVASKHEATPTYVVASKPAAKQHYTIASKPMAAPNNMGASKHTANQNFTHGYQALTTPNNMAASHPAVTKAYTAASQCTATSNHTVASQIPANLKRVHESQLAAPAPYYTTLTEPAATRKYLAVTPRPQATQQLAARSTHTTPSQAAVTPNQQDTSQPKHTKQHQQKPEILSQNAEQVFTKPEVRQVEFATIDKSNQLFQFVRPATTVRENNITKYRLVAVETISSPPSQFKSPSVDNPRQTTTINDSYSPQGLEGDNLPLRIFHNSSSSSSSSDESPPKMAEHQKPIDLSIVNANVGAPGAQSRIRLPEGCSRFLLNMDSKEILVNTEGWDVQKCEQMEQGTNLGDKKMLVQLRKAHDKMRNNNFD